MLCTVELSVVYICQTSRTLKTRLKDDQAAVTHAKTKAYPQCVAPCLDFTTYFISSLLFI